MANALYTTGRTAFAAAGINWTSDTIQCCLVDSSLYTANLSTDQYLSTISGISGAILANSRTTLTSATNSGGKCSAANTVCGSSNISSTTGHNIVIVIYKNTGSDSSSQLIAYLDTGTGLPASNLSSATVTIDWDPTNGIFTL